MSRDLPVKDTVPHGTAYCYFTQRVTIVANISCKSMIHSDTALQLRNTYIVDFCVAEQSLVRARLATPVTPPMTYMYGSSVHL